MPMFIRVLGKPELPLIQQNPRSLVTINYIISQSLGNNSSSSSHEAPFYCHYCQYCRCSVHCRILGYVSVSFVWLIFVSRTFMSNVVSTNSLLPSLLPSLFLCFHHASYIHSQYGLLQEHHHRTDADDVAIMSIESEGPMMVKPVLNKLLRGAGVLPPHSTEDSFGEVEVSCIKGGSKCVRDSDCCE